ncbi:hypothetical protein GIB67_036094 [Kingdonia uniflora]|uniref:Uncharacterized protein n=1 Tax=Kingdonia uniflora TaxID=39325 RepID=A0A7J7N9D6_9MAGN|nr:hypothetical protein GIB67_036094 [Kingdonia uniflora]
MALDAYSLGVKGLCDWWSLLEYWYYEYSTNLYPILQDEATNDAHLYFPRLNRWTRVNLMEKVNREMYNNVSIARVQIELRRVPLHVPNLPHAWYLGERCSLQETQFTLEDMDTSANPGWWFRVVDIDGTDMLLDVPYLSNVPGVPSASLYHDTEYMQYLDESRCMYVGGQ